MVIENKGTSAPEFQILKGTIGLGNELPIRSRCRLFQILKGTIGPGAYSREVKLLSVSNPKRHYRTLNLLYQ